MELALLRHCGDGGVRDVANPNGSPCFDNGVEGVVIVQARPQGSDNACLLDALERLAAMGRQARGVAVIDTAPAANELDAMHRAGVRGERFNLESAGQHDPAVAEPLLRDAAAWVAPLGWSVQTVTTLLVIASLHEVIMGLPAPLVIDPFGRVDVARGTGQTGFAALLPLVKSDHADVKPSAAHRISKLPAIRSCSTWR